MDRKKLVVYLVCEPETPELARAAVAGGRGRRRARLSVLRPARGRPRHPACVRTGARAGDADGAVPGLPRRDARPGGCDAHRADDVRGAPRGVRLGAVRGRRGRSRGDQPDRLRRPRRPAARTPAHPPRRADLDRRADRARRIDHRRLALPRHADRHDRRAGRAVVGARGAGGAGTVAGGRRPALRGVRHLDAGAGAPRRRPSRTA